ncbi:polysaccharide deacetylase family protein [Prosthecobacter dejongeii]|uniref:Peptidoglycan/xylan/chitin deacetylase (PgdA/CDA1 family) n=1 Tax=Prosthecobacter dejongeii TaxID=48465 RepID=A0A7W7YKZ6_9BACT|nr:polysaccharide deacetylase family protein [Prosthecobacter dejongeii]MBB5038128.1 peptidoglycan/xylan/chitin deacetylase (PgdA/CDA1 family) [Prosthecobacter dejongeii]
MAFSQKVDMRQGCIFVLTYVALGMRYFALTLSLIGLLGITACKRIESKLDRLARAAGITQDPPPPPKVAEPVLTPEQEAMEKRLQESSVFEAAKAEDLVPKAVAFELNKSAVVSILGYHDFKERGGSPMIIAASKFREQMKAIKDSGIPVVPLSDVLAWRKGLKNIPEECLVITMDDGWEGVYTYAYPVLKEYGFPFTVYVYKKYVNIGGRSLSWEQIKEMMKYGCEIGSHSVSHESLRAKKGRSEAEHLQWVLAELKDSKEFLEKNLGRPCTSFAYPFGIFDDAMAETGLQVGYETLVTVNSQKVNWDTPMGKIGRFIIHGESDTNFKLATSFRGRGDVTSNHFIKADAKDAEGHQLITLSPAPEEVITERRPTIKASLTRVGTVVPESVRLRIAGLGPVPAVYDPASMTVSYRLPYRLRRQDCAVTLSFKRAEGMPDEVVTWRFKLDLEASYLPQS